VKPLVEYVGVVALHKCELDVFVVVLEAEIAPELELVDHLFHVAVLDSNVPSQHRDETFEVVTTDLTGLPLDRDKDGREFVEPSLLPEETGEDILTAEPEVRARDVSVLPGVEILPHLHLPYRFLGLVVFTGGL
jgi:hypothetical protein